MIDTILNYFGRMDLDGIALEGLRIALILIIALVLSKVLDKLMESLRSRLISSGLARRDSLGESAKRTDTIVRLIRQASLIAIWVMLALAILRHLGVEIVPILAGAGIVGLAVGFGAQNLVRDVISGFFFILEDQIRVGDVAVINGTSGLVEEINFRTIILRDLSGVVHVFPNGTVTTLSNMTKDWSAHVFDLGVAYKEDTDRVIKVIREVGEAMASDPEFGPFMLDATEIFGLDSFGDSAVMIRGRIRTKPGKQWVVGREFNRRIKHAFDAAGIEIPFPHRTVYFGRADTPSDPRIAGALQETGFRDAPGE
ncbi:MAG: mechanosensitive ion channel family protein [Desulfomonilia bacterium]|jgi:small-conductance mechanosensitive channel